jgi:ubiquinone/menaquinone biosynthesis C-methylase UbiE
MNRLHHWVCGSGLWRWTVEKHVIPWALGGADLGDQVLEIGPGPGLTTSLLLRRFSRVTAVEIDPELARAAKHRLKGSHAAVVEADATQLPFPDQTFSGAACFTMLHHVPGAQLQDRLLREVCRVLKAEALFVGSDNLSNLVMKLIHIGDTMVLVDPHTIRPRLELAGFAGISTETNSYMFRFLARRAAS